MKSLYMIFLILFMVSCSSATGIAELNQDPRATIPPEWLTNPPTPFITRAPDGYPVGDALATIAAFNNANPVENSPRATVPPQLTLVPTPTLNPLITPTATNTAVATATELPSATPGIAPTQALARQLRITANPDVPLDLSSHAQQLAAARPNDFIWVNPGEEADITLNLSGGSPLATWVYAVAAPFATIEDEISLETLQNIWQSDNAANKLVLTQNAAATIGTHWGAPAATVAQVDEATLTNALWGQRPSVSIVPFNQLTPAMKVLRLDGAAPIDAIFDQETYPLVVPVFVEGTDDALADFFGAWQFPRSNRDPDKLTRVAMTGVTALVRATATQMEADGILSPGTDVGPILRRADITHISNEVSFAPDCPDPNPIGGTTFCSKPEYFELLTDLQTDVVELTGNHVNDWGADNLSYSIDLYEQAGMRTFGGGNTLEEAQKPAIFQHNGNQIAFVGCNPVGPNYAWAAVDIPGSAPCGQAFIDQIAQLSAAGFQVIATQQYYEFYHYPPTPKQEADFKALIDAGATAVSGSQGHHAQGFSLYKDGFIHYGLGNLFFDQMDMLGTRQTFVDTYTFYDNQLINVDLWTGLIEDYSKPRLMTAEERAAALQSVFAASGW